MRLTIVSGNKALHQGHAVIVFIEMLESNIKYIFSIWQKPSRMVLKSPQIVISIKFISDNFKSFSNSKRMECLKPVSSITFVHIYTHKFFKNLKTINQNYYEIVLNIATTMHDRLKIKIECRDFPQLFEGVTPRLALIFKSKISENNCKIFKQL